MKVSAAIVVLMLFIQGATSAQTTLFPFGSSWKYYNGGTGDPGSNWQSVPFNDSGWLNGPGKLGFGVMGLGTTLTSGNRTYYFRKVINIPDVSLFQGFSFQMNRDDGAIVYVNGVEVLRENMPAGPIDYNNFASSSVSDNGTDIITVNRTLALSQFISGDNTIAVEVHQSSAGSPDLVWDMQLVGLPPGFTTIVTGPYLQKATSSSIVVRWYTADAVDSKVSYGTSPGNLFQSVSVSGTRINHTVTLTGLAPFTKYYYSIETSATVLQSGVDNYFVTSPPEGATGQYRFWVTGDVGDNSSNQRNVRDRYISYVGSNATNGWILLGDNAYTNGTLDAYINNFFGIYQGNIMKNAPLWPATGNHEYANSTARQMDQNVPYFDFFDLPKNAEAGGVPSNSEAYYSFDYGNIHFIALDSYIIENGSFRLYNNGPQKAWLQQDLAANDKEWTIVYFHHPPYTMGSHNSDTENELVQIRTNIVSILEQYDVDLVLTGHSHSYERSWLMKGHTGMEVTFNAGTHLISQNSGRYDGSGTSCLYMKDSPASLGGTVYTVAGSAGQLDANVQGNFPHNAMFYSNQLVGGSLILEIEDNRLDAKWLTSSGTILDQFTMMKMVNKVTNINLNAGQSTTLEASWIGEYDWGHSTESTRSVSITPSSSATYTVTDQYQCITDTYNITVNSLATIDIPSVGFTEICAGSSVDISYSITGTFTAGNVFTLQLSNASGSFSSPVNIGSLTSTAAGTINGVIPANTTTGSNYRLRVVSSSPAVTGTQSAVFTISAIPAAPVVGTITQTTCSVGTGSVVLSGLPSAGTWTLTRAPGSIETTGTGTSTTISGLAPGTYTYTVRNASNCVSPSSSDIVINAQPVIPTAPIVGTTTQPTCSVATGSVVLNGLPSSGTWTLTRSPGGSTTSGTGTSTTVTGLAAGTYTFTVTNAATCISPPSSNVVIDAQPAIPPAPVVELIIQPTCSVATGSVELSGLPSSGTWTLTRNPGGVITTGTGTSVIISGLSAGTYTYTVTDGGFTCVSASSANVVINAQPATPTAPVVGTITQPTCAVATGSVVLSGLPSSGTWTITRSPGGTTTTGTGTSATVSGIPSGTYTFTVTNASTCVSPSSNNVVIDAQPAAPTAPTVGLITQPTCTVSTGSVVLSGLPSSGSWTLTRSPGGTTTTGSGTSTTVSGLPAGTYTYTVTDASGCISPASGNVVIDAQPPTPTAPIVGTITQPTCTVSTGSVVLNGLPSSGSWTLTRSPGGVTTNGSGTSATLSGILSGTYTFTVTNESTCISTSSNNVVIDVQPATPTAPIVGTITQPTCAVATGSVVLSGLPSSGSWTLTRSPGGTTTSGTGISTTLSGLPSGTYTYTVTNESGCISPESGTVVIDVQPATPAAPTVGIITQPTCSVATGSVDLSGLPSSGTWTLTRTPGGITTTGTGASLTLTGLATGTYTFTVTNAESCTSQASSNVVINSQPTTPTVPLIGTITQPTCSVATGNVVINGLPASGTWTLTRSPGGITITGTGISTSLSGLNEGTYSFTVTNASGCVSSSSSDVVINAQPAAPDAPTASVTTQPTCSVPTGTITVTLPSTGAGISYTVTGTNPIVAAQSNATGVFAGLTVGEYDVTTTVDGCTSEATALTIIAAPSAPSAPTVGLITQPTCSVGTGSVVLSDLPSSGTWTLTRNPGGITSTGTGTGTTVPGLAPGTYSFTVTDQVGCVSPTSNVVIDAQPATPTVPTVGTITQPTCSVATGSVVLNGLPSPGTWTITRSPGNVTTTGTGTSTTITGLATGTYTFTVTNAETCISPATTNVVIDAQPATPSAPSVGLITQPTCSIATGSVVLSGLPSSGTWTLTRNPGGITSTGAGTSTTIPGLAAGTYTFTVTDESSCASSPSPDVVIDVQPETPVIADQATMIKTNETFNVTPAGVPDGTTYTWTEPIYTDGVTGGSAQSIPQLTISGTLTIPEATGTATYAVTPTSGSCVGPTFNVQVTVSYAPLPVELLTFTAHASEDEITLRWITASELNNDYFEVQRFITPEEIKTLGRIAGKGTTRDKNEYEFIDAWPVSGNAYYRLKQVDFDGKYEYSKILRVSYNGNRSVKLYPNPGDGTEVTLALGVDEGPLSIVILDATGRHISTSFTHTQPNSSMLEIKFESALTSGMYFFQNTSKAGISTRKWIVR